MKTGDLTVVTEGINSNKFQVSQDGVFMTIYITPVEALVGFLREEQLFDEHWIRIDRRGKLTLPGKQIRLTGLGWPMVNGGLQKRNDLLIRFELYGMHKEYPKNMEGMKINRKEEKKIILIATKEDISEFIRVQQIEYSWMISEMFIRSLIQYILIEEPEWKVKWIYRDRDWAEVKIQRVHECHLLLKIYKQFQLHIFANRGIQKYEMVTKHNSFYFVPAIVSYAGQMRDGIKSFNP